MVFMLSGPSHATELTIGLIPEQNVFNQVARYKPLGEYIEKKTGIKIKFTILSRYGNIEELVILAKSPVVPSNGLGVRKELAFGVKAEIKHALLEMDKDPEGREVLKKFGALRFVESQENDYAPVFGIAEKAGITLENYEYINK